MMFLSLKIYNESIIDDLSPLLAAANPVQSPKVEVEATPFCHRYYNPTCHGYTVPMQL